MIVRQIREFVPRHRYLVRRQRRSIIFPRQDVKSIFGYKSLRKHRYRTVYQINGSRTALRLFIDDTVRFHIMCYVGDMYANLPVPVIQRRAERASSKSFASFGSIVKVVIPRKSSRFSISSGEIASGILSACFLYRGRIFVRQSEFGKDRVHLGGILSGDT